MGKQVPLIEWGKGKKKERWRSTNGGGITAREPEDDSPWTATGRNPSGWGSDRALEIVRHESRRKRRMIRRFIIFRWWRWSVKWDYLYTCTSSYNTNLICELRITQYIAFSKQYIVIHYNNYSCTNFIHMAAS